jgi:hypothetical protein
VGNMGGYLSLLQNQRVRLLHSVYTDRVFLFLFCPTVSDLQEEGKSAINSPMSPALVGVHPEDALLGTVDAWLLL